jgi:hypothetical protein
LKPGKQAAPNYYAHGPFWYKRIWPIFASMCFHNFWIYSLPDTVSEVLLQMSRSESYNCSTPSPCFNPFFSLMTLANLHFLIYIIALQNSLAGLFLLTSSPVLVE